MEVSKELMAGQQALLQELKDENLISNEEIETKCKAFTNILGTLDAIWSSVTGIEQGLLPTEEQLQFLDRAIQKGKAAWIDADLGTGQPKWHLSFDGHLLNQSRKYGGLADKSDATVEKGHQIWKEYQGRFTRMANFEQQQNSIRRAWRRSRHPRVEQAVQDFKKSRKRQKSDSERKRKADDKLRAKKEEKKIKREHFVRDT
jgi:hypothetical protein